MIEFKSTRKILKSLHNKVHIAGRGLVVRQLRILTSQFHVLWTGTLSEIRSATCTKPLTTSLNLAAI
jgi:hypothetical protein